MQNICLTYHVSHSLVYQYNRIRQNDEYREMIVLCASPNITYHDIIREFRCKRWPDALETITVLHDRRVVSLSITGFRDIAQLVYSNSLTSTNVKNREQFSSLEDAQIRLAKELVAFRDFYANGGHRNRSHTVTDYWPKD